MINQYLKERANWVKHGKPYRSEEEMNAIFKICAGDENTPPCSQYQKLGETHGRCAVCGCNLKMRGKVLNKIAWATTKCPLPEPKWKEDNPELEKEQIVSKEDLQEAEKEMEAEVKQMKTPPRRCCGS